METTLNEFLFEIGWMLYCIFEYPVHRNHWSRHDPQSNMHKVSITESIARDNNEASLKMKIFQVINPTFFMS